MECVDGFYCTRTHRVIPPDRAPPCAPEDIEPIALEIASVRAVYEGDYLSRAIAFAEHATSRGMLSQRQRQLFRYDQAAARNLRRVAANLTPQAIDAFRAMDPPPSRHVLLAAARNEYRGSTTAQLRAAAAAVGRESPRADKRADVEPRERANRG